MSLFQPGEETAAGARAMIADGLVDKIPRPDVALAQHVLTMPWAGQVGVAPGPILSTGTCLRVRVFGKGSHGSMPHLGVDPVVLVAAIVTRLQSIVAREIAPGEFGVVTVGSVQAGTKAPRASGPGGRIRSRPSHAAGADPGLGGFQHHPRCVRNSLLLLGIRWIRRGHDASAEPQSRFRAGGATDSGHRDCRGRGGGERFPRVALTKAGRLRSALDPAA